MPSEPFNLIINRDVVLDDQSILYMIETQRLNDDRDSSMNHLIFTDLDAAIALAEEWWSKEGTEAELMDIVSWGVGAPGALPAGKTVDDYTVRMVYDGRSRIQFYIGWKIEKIEELVGEDTLWEMNSESDYGLTIGYAVIAMRWKAEMGRFQ